MTAVRLDGSGIQSPRYAVVGAYANASNAVSHVGILESDRFVSLGDSVPVFHMANPYQKLQLPGSMAAGALGWLSDLSDDERDAIAIWLEELKTNTTQVEYVAFPASEAILDKTSGVAIGRKFSCAGLVQCCFEEALALPLVASTDSLPDVDKALLETVWPAPIVARGSKYGLKGPGPWKVLLPSYLLHALGQPRTGLPHKPVSAEASFPQ